MQTKILAVGIATLAIMLLTGAGCQTYPPGTTNKTPSEPVPIADRTLETSPEAIAEGFYTDYLNCMDDIVSGRVAPDGGCLNSYLGHDSLTQNLRTKTRATIDQMTGPGGYDPLICAQNIPDGGFVVTNAVYPSASEADVVVRFVYGQDQLSVPITLVLEEESWKINFIDCAAATSESAK